MKDYKGNELTEVTEWNGKPHIMKIHVICCNDVVKFAVVDDESKAIEKLKELAEEHFLKNIYTFTDRQEYKNHCYWHIHTVVGA